jgi:hypothetical protein
MINIEAPAGELGDVVDQAVKIMDSRLFFFPGRTMHPQHEIHTVIWDDLGEKVAVDRRHFVGTRKVIHRAAFPWRRTTKHANLEVYYASCRVPSGARFSFIFRPATACRAISDPSFDILNAPANSTAAKPEITRKRGSAREAMDHCFP